jgi:hypothetical protein
VFEDVTLSLAPERLFIHLGGENFTWLYYWNCTSIGTTSDGIMLMVQDVIMNEKIDMDSDL